MPSEFEYVKNYWMHIPRIVLLIAAVAIGIALILMVLGVVIMFLDKKYSFGLNDG